MLSWDVLLLWARRQFAMLYSGSKLTLDRSYPLDRKEVRLEDRMR